MPRAFFLWIQVLLIQNGLSIATGEALIVIEIKFIFFVKGFHDLFEL